MKGKQWLLRAGVVLMLVGLVIPVSLVQANGVTVTLDAPTHVGGTTDFIARLNISHVVNFDACALRVRFDPAVLSLTGVTDGNIGGTTIPVAAVAEKEPGLWGVVANVPGFPGVTGEGYLMEFHFHAADVGAATDTDIILEHYSLSNNDAQAIPATWVGDTVHVFPSDEDGGGGAPGDISKLTVNLLGSVSSSPISGSYRLWRTITSTSPDGNLTINIPCRTRVLNKEGNPLPSLQVTIYENPPPPPENANIIGLACNFEPDGVTFDPPITLTWRYDPSALPEGVAEEDLVSAYYDEEAGRWVELDCTVDTTGNAITASLSHFTAFAIIADVPPPAPAAFSLSNLTVQPAEVQSKEAVTISVAVANTGGTQGSYTVVLQINGVKEAEKSVTIAAGGSETVTFSVTKEDAASYGVTVDGLGGSFTVVAPAVVTNWPVLGGVIAAVVIVALHIIFLVRSEKRRRLGRD